MHTIEPDASSPEGNYARATPQKCRYRSARPLGLENQSRAIGIREENRAFAMESKTSRKKAEQDNAEGWGKH